VKKYSEFIQYPIKLFLSREIRKEVPEEEEQVEKAEEEEKKEEEVEITDEGETKEGEEKKEPKTKTVTEQVWEWETINEIKAIWLRDKSEISEEEYENFYKTITKDHEVPLTYTHFTAEGEIEFKAILFVPSQAPYDLFENYYGKSSALKLYVKRVLITEEFEELMPRYLNFIKGVVDSDDLPLNVSREQL
jgi:heat shock protein beta